ncbi:MAG: HEWD family protein [Halococcoides sp.]
MVEIDPPDERTCERCGREDVWDDERDTWAIRTEDGDKRVGNPHCLHEWDINGAYSPVDS